MGGSDDIGDRAARAGRGVVPIRPARLAYLVATLFVLSLSVTVGTTRYPDRTTVHCEDQSKAEVPICFVLNPTNFRTRAYVIGTGVGISCLLFSLAFRRRLDFHG